MARVKCKFCKRLVKELNIDLRCEDCAEEYKTVVASIIKRYGGAVKQMDNR